MRPSRKLVLAPLFICGAAMAQKPQNSEIDVLLGASNNASIAVSGPTATVSASASAALELAFAYQLRAFSSGYLYMEFPATFAFGGGATVVSTGIVTSSEDNTVWFTPGIRFKLPIHARLSAYGVAGGGVQTRRRNYVNVSKTSISTISEWRITGVADVGGGLDFRLTRLLSLRGEARDFVSGGPTHNHGVYLFGMSFHF